MFKYGAIAHDIFRLTGQTAYTVHIENITTII